MLHLYLKLSKYITTGNADAPLAIASKMPQCNGFVALCSTVW